MAVYKDFQSLAEAWKARGKQTMATVKTVTNNFADFVVERGKANTPVQSGALQSTVRKEVVTDSETRQVIDVVAGGPSAPYARAVHERPPEEDFAHKAEATPEGYPGRQFLSRVTRYHRGELADSLRDAVRRGGA